MGGSNTPDQNLVIAGVHFSCQIESEGSVATLMLAQQPAIDPDARKVVDSSKMDEFPCRGLRGRQSDIDSIPANAGIVAKVSILSVPGQAWLAGRHVAARPTVVGVNCALGSVLNCHC